MKFYYIGTSAGQYNFWKDIEYVNQLYINGESVSIHALQYQDTPALISNNNFNGIDSVIYIVDDAKNISEILKYLPEHIPIDSYSRELDGTALDFLNKLVLDIQKGILISPQKQESKPNKHTTSLLDIFGIFSKVFTPEKEVYVSSLNINI